jgi:hypothetical protein
MAHLGLNRIVWVGIALVTLVAGTAGILRPEIYDGVVSPDIVPGVFTQDLVAVLAALVLLGIALTVRAESDALPVIALGILGFFIYAYGIYAIEQVYNGFYPLYLAILSASVYALIYGFACVRASARSVPVPPSWFLRAAALYSIVIALMFNVIWFGRLIPLLQEGNRIEFTFSILIIDLCFIMPGFVLAAIMALRGLRTGIVALPVLFIVGIGILSPLALAEILKPLRYDMPTDAGSLWLWAVLSLLFLLFAVAHLVSAKPSGAARPPRRR